MPSSILGWCVIVLAVCAANLPFLNQHLFAIIPLSRSSAYKKTIRLRLLELLVLYGVVGGIARYFESTIGNVYVQGWEFYAVTICLFLVFAYPGYVIRYLLKRHA